MTTLAPPAIRYEGRAWSSEETRARAASWHAHLRRVVAPDPPLIAMPMANRPESVALFFALSALSAPLVLLSEDPRSWRSAPAIQPGTPLILSPAQRGLAGPALRHGLRAEIVPEDDGEPRQSGEGPVFFSFPGIVFLTSGTTGAPKPAYRKVASVIQSARMTSEMQDVPRGAGVIGVLPLSTNYGFLSSLALSTVLGGSLALVERFDHRSVLALFASREYDFFACTPLMADILGRCPLDAPPPPAPRVVISSAGQLPPAVRRAFTARFGVEPRVTYGSTEGGLISAVRPGDPEAPDGVGRPAPGVELRIGDDPRRPVRAGTSGRVWYSSPWYMEGYGFPPDLEPRGDLDGWFPTGDLGVVDAEGGLTLLGRSDECFKTHSGHLVNPAEVAIALRSYPAVLDAAVVPVAGSLGAAIGAVMEADGQLDVASLRSHAARLLPPWAQPQVMVTIPALPRMTSGKIDRTACIKLLEAGARPD